MSTLFKPIVAGLFVGFSAFASAQIAVERFTWDANGDFNHNQDYTGSYGEGGGTGSQGPMFDTYQGSGVSAYGSSSLTSMNTLVTNSPSSYEIDGYFNGQSEADDTDGLSSIVDTYATQTLYFQLASAQWVSVTLSGITLSNYGISTGNAGDALFYGSIPGIGNEVTVTSASPDSVTFVALAPPGGNNLSLREDCLAIAWDGVTASGAADSMSYSICIGAAAAPVPEPSQLLMLGAGLTLFLRHRLHKS